MRNLQPCEFRQNRLIPGSNPEREEIVCMAAGGERLALRNGSHARMERICSACPVPNVIANDTWACLYLRPVRMLKENKTYFSCSMFFRLFRSQPEDMRECHGCSYWYRVPSWTSSKGMRKRPNISGTISLIHPGQQKFWGQKTYNLSDLLSKD